MRCLSCWMWMKSPMNKRIKLIFSFLTLLSLPLWSNGWITVRTSVLGAQVAIDQMESVTMHVHELSFAVDEGLHLVIVNKEGYHPHVDTVTVHEGENFLLAIWLEPMTNKTMQQTTDFKRLSWDYQLQNNLFAIRWAGVGAGVGTGLSFHLSFFDMRYGLLTIDPCLWGINFPFFSDVTHVTVPWQVKPRDRRSEVVLYEVAIPTLGLQLYYTPMIGVVLPIVESVAFSMSAGPQISWTKVNWSYQSRSLPSTYPYEFTNEDFPASGFRFDPVWFSVQAGIIFHNPHSDVLSYLKYQDGFFLGIEYRF